MKLFLIATLSLIFFNLNAEEVKLLKGKTIEEKEQELLNFKNIKEVLKNDELESQVKKKQQVINHVKEKRKERAVAAFDFPKEFHFWGLLSEYWLVKNAQTLQWDFQKPEYGIEDAFQGLMEKFGYYNKTFKILINNSPVISHIGLPGLKDEYIFVLSLPFIRTLDLSKVEIALLLLEDYFRIEEGFLQQNLGIKPKSIGENFSGKKIPIEEFNLLAGKYSDVIFKKGFNFKQQFKVTKQMDQILKAAPELWSAYIKMLNKIDRLIKNNLMYKSYNNIYPSPELQIKWLSPSPTVI